MANDQCPPTLVWIAFFGFLGCSSDRNGSSPLGGVPTSGGNASATGGDSDGEPDSGGTGTGSSGTDGSAGSSGDGTGPDDGDDIRLDVGPGGGSGGGESGGGEETCEFVHTPCDAGTTDPLHAIGVNCPGEPMVDSSALNGHPDSFAFRSSFGPTGTFDPREGSTYLALSTGFVSEMDTRTPGGADELESPEYCNRDHDELPTHGVGAWDPDADLPAPLDPTAVVGDCIADPSRVGTGDCSGTIQAQWDQGASARDYVELRFTARVPDNVESISYDFAFFTTEYPHYLGSEYNDIYIGWLESSRWTGNISFDTQGNPISLNAAFMEFVDDSGNLPELADTCMRRHAGTDWLTSTAPVTPGEEITLVFAIMDLSDSILDSVVFLDNFVWGCKPSGPPTTTPVG